MVSKSTKTTIAFVLLGVSLALIESYFDFGFTFSTSSKGAADAADIETRVKILETQVALLSSILSNKLGNSNASNVGNTESTNEDNDNNQDNVVEESPKTEAKPNKSCK
jgi:hypothetical protein